MSKYITTKNLLDCVQGIGERVKESIWYAENSVMNGDAKALRKQLNSCRVAYKMIREGSDEHKVLCWLTRELRGVESNSARLLVSALEGKFERSDAWFAQEWNGEYRHNWATNGGDFYSVNSGDKLNVPSVERMANRWLPKCHENVDKTGSKRLAALLPNPCVRVKMPAKAG